MVLNETNDEKYISSWSMEPICKDRKIPITKGMLYRAYQKGELVGTRFRGTLGIRVSRKDLLNFIGNPEQPGKDK